MTGLGMTLRQLARDLGSQKLRTFLTTFGIVWGTVAVSLLLAFGSGLHHRQTVSMAGLGDRIVIAWPMRTSKTYQGLGKGRRVRMYPEDIEFLKQRVPGIAGISGEWYDTFKVKRGDRVRAVDTSGVSPVFGEMRAMVPQAGGRFINPIDAQERRRVAFVGNQIAADLFGEDVDPVGEELMIHGSPFTVIGVLVEKEQDSSYSGRDHSKIIIPATTFRAISGQKHVDLFIYKAERPDLNPDLTERIRAVLGPRLGFDPSDDQAIQVWDTTEMFVFFDNFMLGFKIFLGVMGVLTLVVGGIGVSNIMNVVVDERRREIGIKMALGARGSSILRQFMLETMLITAVGGGIGLALSALICSAVPPGLTENVGQPILSPGLALLTAAILGLVGLFAGYFPARDAATLDPVVAMKL